MQSTVMFAHDSAEQCAAIFNAATVLTLSFVWHVRTSLQSLLIIVIITRKSLQRCDALPPREQAPTL